MTRLGVPISTSGCLDRLRCSPRSLSSTPSAKTNAVLPACTRVKRWNSRSTLRESSALEVATTALIPALPRLSLTKSAMPKAAVLPVSPSTSTHQVAAGIDQGDDLALTEASAGRTPAFQQRSQSSACTSERSISLLRCHISFMNL